MSFFLLAVVAVWGAFALHGHRRREDELRAELGRLASQVRHLEHEQQQLTARVVGIATPSPSPSPSPTATATPTPTATAFPPASAIPPAPEVPAASALPPSVEPEPLPTRVAPPRAPAAEQHVPLTPSVAPPEAARSRGARPPTLPAVRIDWEHFVGVRLYSWLAGVAVVVAAVSFARYSIDHGFVTAPVRMAFGVAAGLALLLGGETRRAQAYRVTAQALAAGGIATLFSTFYAAHALWRLVPALPTFALLALVAAVAVLVSIRRDALVVALLGLVGGFATPILLSTGENRPVALFSYLLLLNVGLAWVAHRKRWPVLSALSLVATALYQAGWAARFLDGSQLPLAIGVFLVFPVVGFAGLALARRGDRTGATEPPLARLTAAAGAVPPAVLALWLASSGGFAAHAALVFAFLAVVAAGLLAVAAWQGPEWLHLAGGGLVLATVAGFLARSLSPETWPALAAFLAVAVALYAGAPFLLARLGRDLRAEGRLGVFAAPLLLAAFPVAAARLPAASPVPFLGLLLLLAAVCSAHAVLRGEPRVHLLAAALALAGETAWSAFHLAPSTLAGALLAYAAFAGLFLAAPLLAARLGRPFAGGGASPLLVGALGVLVFLASAPVAQAGVASLAGLAVLAALFEAALLLEAARGRSPLLALAGIAVGFAALALWCVAALAAAVVVPALLAAGGLALVAVAGPLLAERGAAQDGTRTAWRLAPLLGLAGHAFLAAVVVRRDLALPAAPWLAIAGALDLAFLAAALWRRRGELLLGAALASALLLLTFLAGLGIEAPAPAIAGGAAVALGALGLLGFLAGRRRGATGPSLARFAGAAAAALHGAQAVLVVAALGDGLPLAFLVAAHAALVAGLLAVAWLAPAEVLTLSAALAGALPAPALWLAGPGGPADALWLAAPPLVLGLAYPLLRGRRGRAERLTFVASVVASAAAFLVARGAIVELGGGPFIGLLPVALAVLLVPHLVLLVRLEPPAARDLGRLALVAAAVLAFVTVAIPLQLEKQWITLGWAAQAAALVWLWRRIPHRGLLAWSAALFAAVFVRLAANPSVLAYHPKSAVPIWNWWLYAYLGAALMFFAGARLAARGGDDRLAPGTPRLSALLAAGGGVLLFVLLNVEIADFWSEGGSIVFRLSAGLAQDLSYTIGWALFAIGVLVAGVVLASRTARVAAIALLSATVLKAFLHDLSRLDGLYRVGSFVGLAACLAVVAVILQRFVLRPGGEGDAGAGPPPDAAPAVPPERP